MLKNYNTELVRLWSRMSVLSPFCRLLEIETFSYDRISLIKIQSISAYFFFSLEDKGIEGTKLFLLLWQG